MDYTSYPNWTLMYPNEDFDRAQRLALKMTEADRAAGNPAPVCGYSVDNFEVAKQIVKRAQRS